MRTKMNPTPMNTFREILATMNDLLDEADEKLEEQERRLAMSLKSYCEQRLSACGNPAQPEINR